jgi:hypothetical protein
MEKPATRLQPADEDRLFCPFCGEVFDARDLGLVLKHYEHQVAVGLPAIDLTPDEKDP